MILTSRVMPATSARVQLDYQSDARASERGVTRHQQHDPVILLVEDTADIRELMRRVLVSAGYEVLVADGGAEALRVSAKHAGRVDLVITDVRMPQMDGTDLVARLSVARPNMKVLFMSGFPLDISESSMAAAACDAPQFLQKPFTLAQLTSVVRDLVAEPEPVG